MFTHIMLASDGYAASASAAALAVELARVHGAKLTVLYVLDPYPYLGIGEANPFGFQAYMSAGQDHAAQVHAQVAALCEQGGAPVALQMRLVENVTAAKGIVQTAASEGADLIVMGSHGRGSMARMMLGSVTSKVLAESHIPALITR